MAAIMAARGQGLEQDFDFFVVVDFEATCVKDARIFPQEIIEFPAVLVDGATGRIESAFRRELTGIRQEDVDGGVDLGDALWLHDAWLKAATAGAGNKRRVRLAVVTWGDWDCRTMLEFECRFKGIEKPSYFDQWINLRVPFQAALGGGGRVNLQEAATIPIDKANCKSSSDEAPCSSKGRLAGQRIHHVGQRRGDNDRCRGEGCSEQGNVDNLPSCRISPSYRQHYIKIGK
ncbi:ERI1 exoribonuclease 2 [Triticum urartu]|uniref:ERI1 exoribonuclease 2 n=1 Tax=Triticum urartu TaxID=4572 RepID=M8AUP3_TRIUA|nr:ERI1 exoribonuclease 2 [Triticum urartu]